MERKQIDTLLPMLYGLAVVVCALWVSSALLPVTVVGAILIGIYFAVFRSRVAVGGSGGRRRSRLRNR